MNSSRPKSGFYALAGIDDLAEFYRVRYASTELLRPEYFDAINRFDIRWARTMWIYDNVRRNSSVLDLGCGSGVLALLKRKGVRLFGLDLSTECVAAAERNGYDVAVTGDLTKLPFPDDSFDYVVSLDVLGHIEMAEKDRVIAEMKRVLKSDGVTMHGIEILNPNLRKGYEEMTPEELRAFILIEGHVGMEPQEDVVKRFERLFRSVQAEPRYSICQSAEELVKQADEYGAYLCDPDLLEYLRGLSFDERRAFNMAMGFVFQRVSDLGLSLPPSEYLFLKATDGPAGGFYNEHADRTDLFPETGIEQSGDLSVSTRARYETGWYAPELWPPVVRWMGQVGTVRFRAGAFTRLSLDLCSHIPDIESHPLELKFLFNGSLVRELSLITNDWQRVEIAVTASTNIAQEQTLAITASHTWQPNSTHPESTDTRRLSIALANLTIE